MPTFYCNYYFFLGTRGPLTLGGPPGLCLPCLPHCYATGAGSGRTDGRTDADDDVITFYSPFIDSSD